MEKICYIIAAGDIDSAENFKANDVDLVICADGGYKNAALLGKAPDIVIGDFDSLGYVPEKENTIVAPKEKDFTDTHLAVELGFEKGYSTFVIFGALGGSRPEHSIANLQLLNHICKKGAKATLVHKGKLFTAFKNSTVRFSENRKGFISVFSLCDESRGVTIKNLKYEVDDFTLTNDVTKGISNEFTGKESTVSVKDGNLLLVYDR